MSIQQQSITVFYDGACPRCVKDRHLYGRLAGYTDQQIIWFDITDQDSYLKSLSIDPRLALTELHLQLGDGRILSELDAYIVLMQRVSVLKPLAWLIALPVIRPSLAKLYHHRVMQRLKASGRI